MGPLISIRQPAPSFSLPDLNGRLYSLSAARGRIAVINFWSAECPQSERADREILAYLKEWDQQVQLFTIAANANEPPDLLRTVGLERGLPLVLHDSDQQVADLYGAQTTPHFFLVDKEGIVHYQGALDDVTFRQRSPSRLYLKQAVEALLVGGIPDPEQSLPYGCSIVRSFP